MVSGSCSRSLSGNPSFQLPTSALHISGTSVSPWGGLWQVIHFGNFSGDEVRPSIICKCWGQSFNKFAKANVLVLHSNPSKAITCKVQGQNLSHMRPLHLIHISQFMGVLRLHELPRLLSRPKALNLHQIGNPSGKMVQIDEGGGEWT